MVVHPAGGLSATLTASISVYLPLHFFVFPFHPNLKVGADERPLESRFLPKREFFHGHCRALLAQEGSVGSLLIGQSSLRCSLVK